MGTTCFNDLASAMKAAYVYGAVSLDPKRSLYHWVEQTTLNREPEPIQYEPRAPAARAPRRFKSIKR